MRCTQAPKIKKANQYFEWVRDVEAVGGARLWNYGLVMARGSIGSHYQ